MLNIRKKNPNSPRKNNLRKSHRISLKATVIIKNFGNKIIAKGKCINASLEGVGLAFCCQAREIFSLKDKVNVLIILPDDSKPIRKTGRIVWYKKNRFFTYRSGIEFE